MIKLFSLKSDSPYFSRSEDRVKSGPNLVQGQTNLDESLASICRDWLSRENKRPHQLPDRLLKSALLCRCRIQVLVSACFLDRRKEWRILRILAAMSTSFFVESRWLRSNWVEPILRRTGKRSYRLHRLASTDFFNQIKRLAFFSAASETLSRRQRMRTLRIRCPLGKCCLSLFAHSVKTVPGKNDDARAGRTSPPGLRGVPPWRVSERALTC